MGFAHRDYKAENLVIDVNCDIKLIDFGLSYRLDQGYATDCLGTTCLMAPEINNHETHCPLKADVFSVGVLLYLLVTGHYPWKIARA